METYSGLGRVSAGPIFPPYLLPPDANDETIGEIVLQALSNSRTLSNLGERIAFFDIEKSKAQSM
ncbi:contact-dependent growth inhibition system immunity protein [Pectobacterium aroidearum]|uniref:contact-dependent growth inhibition system immunity protein n=1 Tax=Pectobacterium aroidearum TaxID=1201031 RepID=UPI0021141CA3|nr:contact-dependent growth inhibition system immunity protein [Pectobacterium aroidearum]UUE59921.1 CdiI family contact-dependent growth inhibition immunity protein [Pectobacterium aroidearum]UUE72731.1 CdiI family contact-dependent growth inhibition immunity protein [Pectobacterium aroidearum]UUE77105.1 CdiI family contact-dependent growth inhibition immunity protein [Pectobacterium aroidearum]UUE81377.1 CdiI family contact-dependent growth inhibition immunity protein [Pectobacterium aroidear